MQRLDGDGEIRHTFSITEHKRGKRNVVTFNGSIQQALHPYTLHYQGGLKSPDYYLFFLSRRLVPIFTKPMSREHAERLIFAMCQDVGLSGSFGTHTRRKTWGYHAQQSGVPMEIIMTKLI